MHYQLQKEHLQVVKDKYEVPLEYQVDYLKDRGLVEFPGEASLQDKMIMMRPLTDQTDEVLEIAQKRLRAVQNQKMKAEMKCEYLESRLDFLQDLHERELKNAYAGSEMKMRGYAVRMIHDAHEAMQAELRQLFV